jgi:hypothetical protein
MTTNPHELRMDHDQARAWGLPSTHAMTAAWRPAHGAAARFLGECFAAGALLGIVTELARPVWGQRHG